MFANRVARTIAPAIALALAGCASSYTGPVEVIRFVADDPAGLGEGRITLVFTEELSNDRAQDSVAEAVAGELDRLGYEVVMAEGPGTQIAAILSSRNPIETLGDGSRGPVDVGVGGSAGTFGSGVGVGVGIDLGGTRAPSIITELAVRISTSDGDTLWEGRAELPTSTDSPYTQIDGSAEVLAAALFRDFPGGNGETVQVTVDELERNP